MAVSKQKKAEILNSLIEQVKNAKSIWFASTKGVTVAEFADLRKKLREVGASYTLAKKTLIVKAVKEALSKVNDFIKATEKEQKMTWSISIFEGKLQDKAETKVIASMPSRETLLSRLVGSMKSPISSLARFFDAAAKDIEAKGKTKVGELEWKKEEKATEAETPAE